MTLSSLLFVRYCLSEIQQQQNDQKTKADFSTDDRRIEGSENKERYPIECFRLNFQTRLCYSEHFCINFTRKFDALFVMTIIVITIEHMLRILSIIAAKNQKLKIIFE